MAATNSEHDTGQSGISPAALRRRASDGRWQIATAAIIALALYFSGAVNPLGGVVIFAAITLAALASRPAPAAIPVAAVESARAASPEAGVGHFAEALPDPCFVLDRRGIVRYANQRATAAYPIRPGEALTFRLRVPDVVAAFDRVAKGGPPERVEYAERVPTERWFAAWFSRLDEPGRQGEFIALIIEDLTERRRSEKIRVDFVANASHELRTPLASLAGFIETLQGPAREDPAARGKFLKIMHEQATRMSRLVDDLLSLTRIEMKAHLRPSGETDLAGVVDHLADALEPLARGLGVTIETELPGTSVVIAGDRDELIQVFENLIENACKYGQSGKRVVITVKAATAEAGPMVTVRDFGPGVAEEHLPRLTERFYRVDIDASRQHRGTGLGLAIVKHILTRHQARLVIESKLGQGASFTVVFAQVPVGKTIGMRDNSYTDQLVR
jgi:two-component system phosphate regulon sensor histidine kinase PhoR